VLADLNQAGFGRIDTFRPAMLFPDSA